MNVSNLENYTVIFLVLLLLIIRIIKFFRNINSSVSKNINISEIASEIFIIAGMTYGISFLFKVLFNPELMDILGKYFIGILIAIMQSVYKGLEIIKDNFNFTNEAYISNETEENNSLNKTVINPDVEKEQIEK